MTNKHAIKSLSGDLTSGQCVWCGNTPVVKDKGKYVCVNDVPKKKAAPKGWAAREKAFTAKALRLKNTYNLTYMQYLILLDDSEYACGICAEPFTKDSPPHIDHDHSCCPDKQSCGICIRGLLCRMCNAGIGYFKDSPQALSRAAMYLLNTKGNT